MSPREQFKGWASWARFERALGRPGRAVYLTLEDQLTENRLRGRLESKREFLFYQASNRCSSVHLAGFSPQKQSVAEHWPGAQTLVRSPR